ncbi:hypothetical protein V6N13_108725 [Hibiscus sabdariffa]
MSEMNDLSESKEILLHETSMVNEDSLLVNTPKLIGVDSLTIYDSDLDDLDCFAYRWTQLLDAFYDEMVGDSDGEGIKKDEKMLFNKLEMIDTCKRLISKDDTIIFEWNSDKKTIEEKYEQIGLAIALNTFDYDKEKLLEKLAKLFSEIEVSEKKNRVMDTLNATKAVVEESIMPCGDVADDIVMSMQLKDVNESSQSS